MPSGANLIRMGLLATLRNALALPALAAAGGAVPAASPFSWPNHLYPVTTPDIDLPLTRAAAMRVPAVKRSRNLIVGSTARCPLVARQGEDILAPGPTWLDRTDGPISPFTRMAWTVDDVLFHGWSLWAAERDEAGNVSSADRVPFEHWSVSGEGKVLVNGTEVEDSSVILIPGVDEGWLVNGLDAFRHAATLNAAAAKAAENPSAQIALRQTQGDPLTTPQIEALVASWVAARRGENGGVAYLNQSVDAKELGAYDAHLLVEGRNAAAVDVARTTGIPAIMLDANAADNRMTYANVDARNTEFVDFCLAPVMAAIAGRLGMDDVVPAGVRIEFDITALTGTELGSVSVPDDATPEEITQ